MIQANYTTLAEHLQGISDPRNRRGRWHEWQYLLLVIASALMAGQRSGRAMAEWASAHEDELIACLRPSRKRIPSAATLYRVLSEVPIEQLESRISSYTTQIDQEDAMMGSVETAQGEILRGQSLDGKSVSRLCVVRVNMARSSTWSLWYAMRVALRLLRSVSPVR